LNELDSHRDTSQLIFLGSLEFRLAGQYQQVVQHLQLPFLRPFWRHLILVIIINRTNATIKKVTTELINKP
jgi:hypothetical protein